jgi:hypothetical protein
VKVGFRNLVEEEEEEEEEEEKEEEEEEEEEYQLHTIIFNTWSKWYHGTRYHGTVVLEYRSVYVRYNNTQCDTL